MVVAAWAWEFIPDSPGTACFLSPRLKDVAVMRLSQENEVYHGDGFGDSMEKQEFSVEKKRGVNIREVFQTLMDPKCYLTAVSIPHQR